MAVPQPIEGQAQPDRRDVRSRVERRIGQCDDLEVRDTLRVRRTTWTPRAGGTRTTKGRSVLGQYDGATPDDAETDGPIFAEDLLHAEHLRV